MLKPVMAWRRLKKSLALVLGFTLLTGCSYISTLDPNDNSRLEQLKLKRQAEAAAANQDITLPQLKQRVDGLRNAQYIFRTKIKDKVLVVEAFSSLQKVQGAVEAAFSDTPSAALERIKFVNGVRGPEDQVPTSLILENPEGMMMFFSELDNGGTDLWVKETYERERDLKEIDKKVEDVYHIIRNLVLLKDRIVSPIERGKYKMRFLSTEMSEIAFLLLDEDKRLQIELPDGSINTYLLINNRQYLDLVEAIESVIHYVSEESSDDGEPEIKQEFPWLELPYGEENVVIASEFIELSNSDEIKQEVITIEIGLVAYGEQGEEGRWIIGAPEERLKITHHVYKKENASSSWEVPTFELISEEKAQEVLDTWGIEEAPIAERVELMRELTLYSFLINSLINVYTLDPQAVWR